jgi:DNA-binding response OmpR family regulator
MLKTILIAANDPNIIYLLRRYAEASGFDVVRCDFGDDLLRLARQINPVMILLEIEPPETSWKPYLQRLKSDLLTKPIPVVVYSCIEDVIYSPVDEISSFLQKSVMYNDFIAALNKAGVHPVE